MGFPRLPGIWRSCGAPPKSPLSWVFPEICRHHVLLGPFCSSPLCLKYLQLHGTVCNRRKERDTFSELLFSQLKKREKKWGVGEGGMKPANQLFCCCEFWQLRGAIHKLTTKDCKGDCFKGMCCVIIHMMLVPFQFYGLKTKQLVQVTKTASSSQNFVILKNKLKVHSWFSITHTHRWTLASHHVGW